MHGRKRVLTPDVIYSGFLGAAEQVAKHQRLKFEHPVRTRVVDPVKGRSGNLYVQELCDAMKSLQTAHIMTSNLLRLQF